MKKTLILYCLLFGQIILAHNFIFHDHEETMKKIMGIIVEKQKGSYFRTGDGDVYLASGISSGTHPVNPLIQKEMKEALSMQAPTILKTLPLDPNSYRIEGSHYSYYLTPSKIEEIAKKAEPVWGSDRNVYSAIFLSHYAVIDMERAINFLKFLKSSNCSLLIGNENISSDIASLLFGDDCLHIKTPQKNPYNAIDLIEQESLAAINQLDPNQYHVVIMCVGNTGRVLVKRIYDKVGPNVFFFDFGSLIDALCGFGSRYWIRNFFKRDVFLAKLRIALAE